VSSKLAGVYFAQLTRFDSSPLLDRSKVDACGRRLGARNLETTVRETDCWGVAVERPAEIVIPEGRPHSAEVMKTKPFLQGFFRAECPRCGYVILVSQSLPVCWGVYVSVGAVEKAG
jgi:hypothetical protein